MLTFTQNPLHWEYAQAKVDDSAWKKKVSFSTEACKKLWKAVNAVQIAGETAVLIFPHMVQGSLLQATHANKVNK